MKTRVCVLIAGVLFLGQGCLPSVAPAPAPVAPAPLGEPSPEGFVAFREGFGKLPSVAPALPAGPRPSVTLSAQLPTIPPEVTVLRQRQTAPNDVLLDNVSIAVRIPAGTLGRAPVATELGLRWEDDQGYKWTFSAADNRLSFERLAQPSAATVSNLTADDSLLETARTWLDSRGAYRRGWGNPEPSFSWQTWWAKAFADKRCMDAGSLTSMREIGSRAELKISRAPLLLKRDSGARCLNPEFPLLQSVDYQALRDEQPVVDAKGAPVLAARLAIDTKLNLVQTGWFELQPELDRSNYPALAPDEILTRLRAGGLNPTALPVAGQAASSSEATVTFDSLTLGLYRHVATVDRQPRVYFVPALWARGTLRHADGSAAGYATVVPLVKDDAFGGP